MQHYIQFLIRVNIIIQFSAFVEILDRMHSISEINVFDFISDGEFGQLLVNLL